MYNAKRIRQLKQQIAQMDNIMEHAGFEGDKVEPSAVADKIKRVSAVRVDFVLRLHKAKYRRPGDDLTSE